MGLAVPAALEGVPGHESLDVMALAVLSTSVPSKEALRQGLRPERRRASEPPGR